MSQIGNIYAQSLYSLAKDEALEQPLLEELKVLGTAISDAPDLLRLLSAANIPMAERRGILDDIFRDRVHPYVLNFMKILTERGYMHHFGDCCKAYRELYNSDHGILAVTAVTASDLSKDQAARLKDKLARISGKQIELEIVKDAACLGGIRLDYNGVRVDDTMAHRLETLRNILKNTVL